MENKNSFFTGNRVFAILCMIYGIVLQFGESVMTQLAYDIFFVFGAIVLIYLIFLLERNKYNL